jgi:hypothetical protein
MIRAYSLTQPFATLVALGYKFMETRSKRTHYRGPLLIHASSTRNRWSREACEKPIIAAILAKHGLTYKTLPRGELLCRVELLDMALITDQPAPAGVLTISPTGPELSETERAVGLYSEGRYAWLLSPPELLPEPVKASGALSFWDATPALEAHEAAKKAEAAAAGSAT